MFRGAPTGHEGLIKVTSDLLEKQTFSPWYKFRLTGKLRMKDADYNSFITKRLFGNKKGLFLP
jgi:hypothetical protein